MEDGAICNVEATLGIFERAFSGGNQLTIVGEAFSGSGAFPGNTGRNGAAPFPSVVPCERK